MKFRSSGIKKIFFYSVIFLVNYLLFELVAYGFYRLKFGEYDAQDMQATRARTIANIEQGPVFTGDNADKDKQDIIQKEVIHPYFGYTIDGKERIKGCEGDNVQKCYRRIKMPTDTPFPKRSDDKLIVAVLGGSVAVGTTHQKGSKYSYAALLAKLPEYKGREVIVYALNAGGLRQPQQAMMLNYFYLMGAEFDLIISLDGFNDVVVPAYDYRSSGAHPSYPKSWANRVSQTLSPDLVDLLAQKQNLEASHKARATLMSNSWLKNSPICNLLWQISHVNYSNKHSSINESIFTLGKPNGKNNDFHYEALGPDYNFTTWEDLHQYSVDMWARSSLLISKLATVNNAKYLHFLQPNQYIEGSKPLMSEAEKKVALLADVGYGNLYKQIYPRIQKKAPWLKDQGIEYHDLSYLYKDVSAPLYIDNCCHVNSAGSHMMIKKIVDTIHQSNLSSAATLSVTN